MCDVVDTYYNYFCVTLQIEHYNLKTVRVVSVASYSTTHSKATMTMTIDQVRMVYYNNFNSLMYL